MSYWAQVEKHCCTTFSRTLWPKVTCIYKADWGYLLTTISVSLSFISLETKAISFWLDEHSGFYDFDLWPESENCVPSVLCLCGRRVTLESVCGHCCIGCLQRACWPCEPSPPLKQSSLIACRNWNWPSTSWWDIKAPSLPHSSAVVSSTPHCCVSVTALPAGQTEETHTEPKCIWAGSLPLWPSGAGKSFSDLT